MMWHQNKALLLSIVGFLLVIDIHSQWITERPTTSNLNSICLSSDDSGWIVGDQGTMLYKHEDVWHNYKSVTKENLASVCLIGKDEGWAVGTHGIILHFDGIKWEIHDSPTSHNLNAVNFRDSDHGIAVGANGTTIIYESGIWKITAKNPKVDYYAVSGNENIMMIGGGREYVSIPVMKIKVGSGKDFIKTFDPDYIEIRSLNIINEQNVWAVGRPGTIFHYDGDTWKRIARFDKLPSLNCVSFLDENNGIAVGYSGTVLTYKKNGWIREETPVNVKLNGAAVTETKYYAVGNNGIVLTMEREPELFPQKDYANPSSVSIKAYPNPTSGFLNIIVPEEFNTASGILTITDTYGHTILMNELIGVKSGQVYRVNTSELTKGLYLLNLTDGATTASGKLIIMH